MLTVFAFVGTMLLAPAAATDCTLAIPPASDVVLIDPLLSAYAMRHDDLVHAVHAAGMLTAYFDQNPNPRRWPEQAHALPRSTKDYLMESFVQLANRIMDPNVETAAARTEAAMLARASYTYWFLPANKRAQLDAFVAPTR